jgi:hypothetical protein
MLYLKTIERQYIYSPTDDSEVVLVFERNNAGLKNLSSVFFSEQKSDSSVFLNVTRFLKYILNCEQHFSFFIFWSWLPDIRINCNRISEDFGIKFENLLILPQIACKHDLVFLKNRHFYSDVTLSRKPDFKLRTKHQEHNIIFSWRKRTKLFSAIEFFIRLSLFSLFMSLRCCINSSSVRKQINKIKENSRWEIFEVKKLRELF